MTDPVRFTLNGVPQEVAVPLDRALVDILREEIGAVEAKVGCAVGRCGACMVLVDGAPRNGCLVMAWQIDGRQVETARGLDGQADAETVRAALDAEVAFQCGYCAPGIVASLVALFRARPQADEAAIRTALEGHVCRCTGYHSILRGARAAAARLRDTDRKAAE